MKIILAPDSFKGSLTAAEVCAAMREGILRACSDAQTVAIPMADGGEGTAEALAQATGGEIRAVPATGPLGEPRTGQIALLGDGRTAVLEMACVSGLPLVPKERRNPLHTTTYGTGQLIAAAWEALGGGSDKRILVGIGGSATTDLGAGMAQALGVRFLRADGSEIREPMTGATLAQVARVDVGGLDGRLRQCTVEAACDVDNPLLGPRGSAAVYGPQKGATPEIVQQLEANLGRAVDLVERAVGRPVRDAPGAGAAGGLGAGLLAFLGAELKPGIRLVLEASRFAERVAGADLVLTGEGQIDAQTAYGKTISGVARTAKAAGVPVIALVGGIVGDVGNLYDIGVTSMFPICPGPMSLDDAIADAAPFMASAAERVIRAVLARWR